jgi:hypothetical protein
MLGFGRAEALPFRSPALIGVRVYRHIPRRLVIVAVESFKQNTGVPSASLRTGFSTSQRTMWLSAASVEMTYFFADGCCF